MTNIFKRNIIVLYSNILIGEIFAKTHPAGSFVAGNERKSLHSNTARARSYHRLNKLFGGKKIMVCKQCGAQNADNVKFCSACGARMEDD
ncbi:MAG: zinc ribbon domain-containing protein, partial [Clostridia bacterium]|nr:zinc ribbon domain-containing protein [Clostridia bacterium]